MIRYEDGENRGRRDIPFLASTVHILWSVFIRQISEEDRWSSLAVVAGRRPSSRVRRTWCVDLTYRKLLHTQRTHTGDAAASPLDNHTSILLVKKEEVVEFQPLSGYRLGGAPDGSLRQRVAGVPCLRAVHRDVAWRG